MFKKQPISSLHSSTHAQFCRTHLSCKGRAGGSYSQWLLICKQFHDHKTTITSIMTMQSRSRSISIASHLSSPNNPHSTAFSSLLYVVSITLCIIRTGYLSRPFPLMTHTTSLKLVSKPRPLEKSIFFSCGRSFETTLNLYTYRRTWLISAHAYREKSRKLIACHPGALAKIDHAHPFHDVMDAKCMDSFNQR